MCHVAQATSRYLCGQLLAVTIDLADSIVTVCRLVGHGARLDYIIAAGVALLLSDLGTLLEQEFDLLLKTVGVSPDLSQLLALEILQRGLSAPPCAPQNLFHFQRADKHLRFRQKS